MTMSTRSRNVADMESAGADPAPTRTLDAGADEPRLDPAERAEILYANGTGSTYDEIAELLGVSTSTVGRHLKRRGVTPRDTRFQRMYPKPKERECARPGCTNRFTPTATQVANGFGKYCSRECDHEDRPSAKLDEAKAWLERHLLAGPSPRNEVEAAARKAGHAWATIRRAADELNVWKRRQGPRTGCRVFWGLPHADDGSVPRRKHRITCDGCGVEFDRWESEIGERNFHDQSCRSIYTQGQQWTFGGPCARALVEFLPGDRRRWWKIKFIGKQRQGRPRGWSDEDAARVLALRAQHPGMGRAGLALYSDLSEKQVRAILQQHI